MRFGQSGASVGWPARAQALVIGSRVGRYRVVAEVGRGGMGVVYRAQDERLGRPVALKFLPTELLGDPETRERFEVEARAASALDHATICTIYEIDETDDGRVYIAMAWYEGETLADRIARGPLPVADAVRISQSVAAGLARAHEAGIVHRDIKPANLMLTEREEVKILDFGVAKLAGEVGLTRTGVPIGTLAYMAPEQAGAESVGPRADLWGLGVVLYEMLTAVSPFSRRDAAGTAAAVLTFDPRPVSAERPDIPPALDQLIGELLSRDPDARPAAAADVAQRLDRIFTALAPVNAPPAPVDGVAPRDPRKGRILAGMIAVVVIAALGWTWSLRSADRRWARTEAVPEVLRLVGENRMSEAAALALQAGEILGEDPLLDPLWPRMTTRVTVTTEPAGAQVWTRPYEGGAGEERGGQVRAGDESTGEWRLLGTSPLDLDRHPLGATRFRVELEGYEPLEVVRSFISRNQWTELVHAGFDYLDDASYAINATLTPSGELPQGMLKVSGGLYATVPLLGFGQLEPRMIPDYWIDSTEVTHEAYAEFVEAGGYDDPQWWREAFDDEDRVLSFADAVARFTDATGRPGPATWALGPPEGLANHPVTGVSWFEAAAFCTWRGAALPTLYHWARAALPSSDAWIPFVPILAGRSNLDGTEGTVPVGSLDAMGVSGAQDLVGNAREWTSTSSGPGRYLMGGAWSDLPYVVSDASAPSPWRRREGDGFRCARYPGGEAPEELRQPLVFPVQEFTAVEPSSDEAFETARSFYTYDADLPLAARVDSARQTESGMRVEWVSVDTPYGERLPIRLHIPIDAEPPYSSVVFFPGSNVLRSPEIEDIDLVPLDFIVRSGRVLIEPVYDGAFQRNDGRTLQRWGGTASQRELLRHWVQDLGRTIDYLDTRDDMDAQRVAYMGLSLGAVLAPQLLAYEPRFAGIVLYSGGFGRASSQATIDRQTRLAGRVEAPVLMLVGRDDIVSPLEPHKTAFLRSFGAPDDEKVLRAFDAGHWPLPMNDVIRETIDFLERFVDSRQP